MPKWRVLGTVLRPRFSALKNIILALTGKCASKLGVLATMHCGLGSGVLEHPRGRVLAAILPLHSLEI